VGIIEKEVLPATSCECQARALGEEKLTRRAADGEEKSSGT